MASRLYSYHLFTGHFNTDDSGDGFPIGNVGGIQVVWKQIDVDATELALLGNTLTILKNASYCIYRKTLLPVTSGNAHDTMTDLRFTWNNPDDDEFNIYVDGGQWDVCIDGFLLSIT